MKIVLLACVLAAPSSLFLPGASAGPILNATCSMPPGVCEDHSETGSCRHGGTSVRTPAGSVSGWTDRCPGYSYHAFTAGPVEWRSVDDGSTPASSIVVQAAGVRVEEYHETRASGSSCHLTVRFTPIAHPCGPTEPPGPTLAWGHLLP